MTFGVLNRTAAANAQGEERVQAPVSAQAAAVLRDPSAITPANSTSSSSTSIRLLLDGIDSLLETLDIVGDAELMASIRRGMQESAEGKGEELDDVFAELGWE